MLGRQIRRQRSMRTKGPRVEVHPMVVLRQRAVLRQVGFHRGDVAERHVGIEEVIRGII
jgi:hypothetical protein